MTRFTSQTISTADAPPIEFQFDRDVGTAEYAGAKLRAEAVGPDRADVTIKDATGEVLADLVVRKMPRDESITVSVMNVGSALLWSHYRWQQSQPKSDDKRVD